ncbi:hypothetical protein PR202_gb11255 [Eleusine coracana subsp. coracana]|uniref:Uncharacterized protein n=1 Tax=Eleusine coracana subsp. coracana TaxID=191504 RepID=A0AAV5EM34_ELECO|nr:hypothetical protein PR202_gb11255 [Eleusine coracana subsp. coracana]
MAMPFARRDIEAAGPSASGGQDSPAAKKGKTELAAAAARPRLRRSEALAFAAVLALFTAGIFCVFLTAPRHEFGQILRLPRSLADVRLLKDNLAVYARDHQAGRALGDLKSVRELYDFKTLVVLFLIGSVAVVPTILKRKRTYE